MSRYTLKIDGRSYTAEVLEISAEQAVIRVDEHRYTVGIVEIGRPSLERPVAAGGVPSSVSISVDIPPPAGHGKLPSAGGAITAPLPGLVLAIEVKEGQGVESGQSLLTMEAMKMENQITAPHNGIVRKIFVSANDSVAEGDPLIEISRPGMTTL